MMSDNVHSVYSAVLYDSVKALTDIPTGGRGRVGGISCYGLINYIPSWVQKIKRLYELR